MERIKDLFFAFFQNFHWVYAVEFVLVFLLVYYVLKVLKQNGATRLIALYVVVTLLAAVVCTFSRERLLAPILFLFIIGFLSIFMLLLFSVEIKRSIWEKKNSIPVSGGKEKQRYLREDTERHIEAIIKALQNMSKNDVGALIVLSNGNLPKQVLDSGTAINADISQQLIEGVFFPKAPLHDGAMIIEDHVIRAAGCFLPLTQNNEQYPKDLGTRHRAGIGITEVTNVISLIVSEETGIISIVKQGKVTRYADYTMLKEVLRKYYWKDIDGTEGKKRSAK